MQVGDHIEKLDGRNLVGCRHFEVAKALKEIPRGTKFILRVIEPLKSGFCEYNKTNLLSVTGIVQFSGRILLRHSDEGFED